MNSIRMRLSLALIVLVAFTSVLAASITYRRVLHETSILFDYQLEQMALSLRSEISLAPRIEVPPDQGNADFVIQIWDTFGARVYLSRPGLPLINQVVLGYADLTLDGKPWRAYGLSTSSGVIQIAQPVHARERLARAAAVRIVVPLVLLLPVMIVFVAWSVGRGLRPLRRVTADIQHRDIHSLTPLRNTSLPREIIPLVAELNRLLTRLRDAFALQSNFIADAAHELRSPLTAVRLQLQLLDRAPDEAARVEARTRLGEAVERSIHLVEQLLVLARSDAQPAHEFRRRGDADPARVAQSAHDLDAARDAQSARPRDAAHDDPQSARDPPSERQEAGPTPPVDLAAAAAQAVADTHALAESRGVDLDFDAPPGADAGAAVRGDAEALRILVRNLADNAVRYTPRGGHARVTVSAGPSAGTGAGSGAAITGAAGIGTRIGAGALLEVVDTGPGIPAAERERVFDRFYRRATLQEGGTGLGLAIVKAIAKRHGATVALDDALNGGLRVVVRFPPIS